MKAEKKAEECASEAEKKAEKCMEEAKQQLQDANMMIAKLKLETKQAQIETACATLMMKKLTEIKLATKLEAMTLATQIFQQHLNF